MSNSNTPHTGTPLSIDLREACTFTCERHVINLFKEFLLVLQQLSDEHDEAMDKLCDQLPPEYKPFVDLADHFTEEKGQRIRSVILGRGNDCRRAIRDELAKYDITFKQNHS